jgi:type IV pilus assembly protein PilW
MKMNRMFWKKGGFSLVELLITMAITMIISSGLFSLFHSQLKIYIVQGDVAATQQNLRAGMDMMVRDLRMAGFDPEKIGGLGVLNITPRNIKNKYDGSVSGNGAVQISADFDEDGVLDGSETISYSIYDSPVSSPDGNYDLARNSGAGRQLLSENIEALGIAYAGDSDGDGKLDLSSGGNIIWAVDSDGDNDLDTSLDTNDDGVIDADDGPGAGGNGLISGTGIFPNVDIADIRAIRIWMLGRTDRGDKDYLNTHTYVVGNKVITPADKNNYRMRLLTAIVKCRNIGL